MSFRDHWRIRNQAVDVVNGMIDAKVDANFEYRETTLAEEMDYDPETDTEVLTAEEIVEDIEEIREKQDKIEHIQKHWIVGLTLIIIASIAFACIGLYIWLH